MSTSTLTVLSVRQPWASLLVTGEDWCENRTWSTNHRGPLWIHAGSKIEVNECEAYGIDPKSLVTGAIIGCVDVVDVLDSETDRNFAKRIADLAEEHGLDMDIGPDFIVGPFCWIVTNGRMLVEPITVKGKLNLWKFEPGDHSLETQVPTPIATLNPGPVEVEEEILVEGRKEVVLFIADDGGVKMEFEKRGKSRYAKSASSSNYRDGEPYYRAGCEKAWELFPELFDEP